MKCPSCGSTRVYPSHLKNIIERIREGITGQQPHRCHECGRRSWGPVTLYQDGSAEETRPDDLRTGSTPPPVKPTDLDGLDPIRSKR